MRGSGMLALCTNLSVKLHVQPRADCAQTYILPHCYILFFCRVFSKHLWLVSVSFSNCMILETGSCSCPVQTHTHTHWVDVEEYKGYCQLGLLLTRCHWKQRQKNSNCCALCCLILLDCFCICLKAIIVIIFLNMGINKCLGFFKDEIPWNGSQENILQQQSAL